MNTKKNKNKNKSKPVQLLQENENTVNENVTRTENVEKVKSLLNEDNKVHDLSIVEDNYLIDDIPKKPKRTKSKKKSDALVEDDKRDELFKSPKHQELEENGNNYPEKCIQEVPSVRKKKNKNKKHNTQLIADEDALSPLVEISGEKDALKEGIIEPSVGISPQNTENTEKESSKQKKKKKKKNRFDADKSDKTETQNSCTLAFQKLLQPSDQCNQEASDSETISSAPVDVMDNITETATEETTKVSELLLEKIAELPLKEVIKRESSKIIDKNIKVKKQAAPKSVEMESSKPLESIITKDNIVAKDDTNSGEDIPRPKAQIAKPVEKKRKAKRSLQETNNESVSPSLIKADECFKVFDTTQLEKVHIEDNNIILASIESENIIKEQAKHKKIKKCEEPTSESSECSHRRQDKEQSETVIEADNSDFVKVKAGKSKKKKNKDIDNHPTAESEKPNIEKILILNNLNVSSEQTKPCSIESGEIDSITPDCIVAPDFIDYPRSVSQIIVDNNNNTIIQEITTPEEIKLGIPIFTTVPIIQGSGESPEAQNNKPGINTNVTEIELKTNSSVEKTDIKSKMIEVNRDMEELRRSIERSLAGLTNIEESDSNIEKDFEEIFQNQSKDSQAVEMPNIFKKYGNENLNDDPTIKDQTENEKRIVSETNFRLYNMPAKDDSQATFEIKDDSQENIMDVQTIVPVCPVRKDKGKGKSKKKGKQDISRTSITPVSVAETPTKNKNADSSQEAKKEEKSNQKTSFSEEKCRKKTQESNDNCKTDIQDRKKNLNLDLSFEPIENFEDALTSSVDDINKTFELIANETNESKSTFQYQNNPEINITAPAEDIEQEDRQKEEERRKKKQTPVSPPKNLLGHTDMPVQSNNADYKKEKNKAPNYIRAKVKIKDSIDIEKKSNELVKKPERRTGEVSDNIQKYGVLSNNTNQEFVYKYNFRKVFLQSLCHLCKNEITHRIPCQFCSIVFYCSPKHKDEDWPQHQPLCFAISTIAHLKDQKHIYADAKNITGQDYRVLRMQMILSCERILKRKLVPWEQEAMLYPRVCADAGCRQWKQSKLTDCRGCGQISYCTDHPEHLPLTHQRWCKPYALYKKLVMYHQNFGKLEPRLPTKVLEHYQMTDNINEVLGSMYEEKIDISDIQYAALTQIASASLTTVYCYQLFTRKLSLPLTNGMAKSSKFTVHSIGSELQSEADSLNKWETFFLHLLTDVKELQVVFIDPDLNQSNLPLDLLGKIKLCDSCRTNKRRVIFNFEDKKNYHDYYSSDEFIVPNIVCAFNPNIQRSSIYGNKYNWPATINCILRQKIPFVVTSYTLEELKQDIGHIKRLSRAELDVISEPKYNPFASVRPDRNFITDHEMPLLFKNYSFSILCGA